MPPLGWIRFSERVLGALQDEVCGKWIWNDFGDIGGTVIDFIMRHEGYSQVKDALSFLENMFPGHLFETASNTSQSGPNLFSFQQQKHRYIGFL